MGRGGASPEKSKSSRSRSRLFNTPTASSAASAGSTAKKATKKRGRPHVDKTVEPTKLTKRSDAAKYLREMKAKAAVFTAEVNQRCSDRGEGASEAHMVCIIADGLGPVKSGVDRKGDNNANAFATAITLFGPENQGKLRQALKLGVATVVDRTEGAEAKLLPPKHTGTLYMGSSVLQARQLGEAIRKGRDLADAASSPSFSSPATTSCQVEPKAGSRRISSAQLKDIGDSTKVENQR